MEEDEKRQKAQQSAINAWRQGQPVSPVAAKYLQQVPVPAPAPGPKIPRISSTSLAREIKIVVAELIPGDADKRTYLRAIAETICKKAVDGNMHAISEILDRLDGRPVQAIEHTEVLLDGYETLAARKLRIESMERRLEELREKKRG